MIDWGEVVTAGSVAVAAISFVSGVTAWKREFIGKRRIELAESVLAQFYEARDAVAMIRNPFSFTGEGKSREKQPHETEEQAQALDQAYVAFERYQKREQLFADLQSTKYRFMATFGPESGAPFDELTGAVNQVLLAARTLGTSYWQNRQVHLMDEGQQKQHFDSVDKYERIFWATGEDDQIAERIDAAIAQIEAIVSDETKPRARWAGKHGKGAGS